MYNAVIIDDDKNARNALRNILENFSTEISIVAEGKNVADGVNVIKSAHPDIVFLDIEMPDGTGFDVLKQVRPYDFSLIFVTGHNDFAIKAFKFNALDYILKPADIEDVIAAVEKAKQKQSPKMNEMILSQLLSSMNEQKQKKIILKTSEDIFILNIEDIIRCESDGGYTTFYTKTGQKIMVSKNLKEYESILKNHHFIRTHNSHLVNLNYVSQFRKTDNMLIMKDSSVIPISVRKKEAVLFALENF